MQEQKPLAFNASAASYFIVFIVTVVTVYIPIIGWAFGFNFMNKWIAENLTVEGKKVTYQATFGEALKFTFIGGLLTVITFGIYGFWYVPKSYKFFTDHVSYEGGAAPLTPNAAAPIAPLPSAAPTPPTAPTPEVAPQPPVTSFAPTPPAAPAPTDPAAPVAPQPPTVQ